MSQNWNPPSGTVKANTSIKTLLVNMALALRSLFAGSSAPSTTEAYMLWADTANNQLKQRNAADSGWDVFGKLHKDHGKQIELVTERSSVSATFAAFVFPCHEAGKIKRIVIVPDTASSSSSGNEWQFGLQNKTTTNQLFSGTVGTFTTLGGVGGGEFAVDTAYVLTPDQNDTVSLDDVLEFTMTKVGTVTTITRLSIFVEYTMSE